MAGTSRLPLTVTREPATALMSPFVPSSVCRGSPVWAGGSITRSSVETSGSAKAAGSGPSVAPAIIRRSAGANRVGDSANERPTSAIATAINSAGGRRRTGGAARSTSGATATSSASTRSCSDAASACPSASDGGRAAKSSRVRRSVRSCGKDPSSSRANAWSSPKARRPRSSETTAATTPASSTSHQPSPAGRAGTKPSTQAANQTPATEAAATQPALSIRRRRTTTERSAAMTSRSGCSG